MIYTASKYRNQLKAIDKIVFGDPPPGGLSVSWGNRNPQLMSLLESNGIVFNKYAFHDSKYMAWTFDDHQKVEDLLKFEPWKKAMYKRFPEENRLDTEAKN